MELRIVTGTLVAFSITFGTKHLAGDWAWRLPFLLQLIPGLVLGFSAFVLPFSPRWLASRFENKQALYFLAQLRHLSPENCKVQNEWMEMRVDIAYLRELNDQNEAENSLFQTGSCLSRLKIVGLLVSWFDCFKSRYWRRTHIAVGIMFFQQFVGINVLLYSTHTVFKEIRLNNDMQLAMTGILGAVQLVGVSSCLWTIDKIGRKRLLVYGSCLMLICGFIFAGLICQFSSVWSSHRDAAWICIGFLFLYTLAFGATWGSVAWTVPSEIFPTPLRAKGIALSACSYWL